VVKKRISITLNTKIQKYKKNNILGRHFVQIVQASQVTRLFNSHLKEWGISGRW